MCNNAVNTHGSTIEYIPDRFKIQEMCEKAVDRCFLVFYSVLDQ